MLIIFLISSGCIEEKQNKNVGYEIIPDIQIDCKYLNEQCWTSLDNLLSGRITMQAQVIEVSNGEVNASLTSVFNINLPNIPTILYGIDNKKTSLKKIKTGNKITFTTNIKPLSPARDLIKYAIITRIFPNKTIIDAQKYIKALQQISKIQMLIKLYDVEIVGVI